MRGLVGDREGRRRTTIVLLVVGSIASSIACGRVGFEPFGLRGGTGDPDAANGDGDSASTCVTLDNVPPAPAFDCATVEGVILSGNIASISDADLIAWARNDCMRKPAPSTLAATPASAMFAVTPGSGPSCSSGAPPGAAGMAPDYIFDGSGTLNLGSFTGTCGGANLLGTYEQIQFATISASSAINTHYDGCRTIHVDRLSAGAILRAYDYAVSDASPYPVHVRLGTIENTGQLVGGGGSDLVVVTANLGGNRVATAAGDDTVVIGGGIFSDDAGDTFLELGDGNDTAYIRELGVLGASPEGDVSAGTGADHIYFNAFRAEDIFGEGGDDVLSCTGLFGVAGCTSFGEWAFLEGNGGNDIISVDGPLIQTPATGGTTTIDGGGGFNIVYVKSVSNTANRQVSIGVTTTGSSLLVIGGDHSTAAASTVTAAGANNVLLVKSGAANTGFTFTGFARTLSY